MNIKKCTLKTMCAVLTCTTFLSGLLAVNATDTIITETPMDDSVSTESNWNTEESNFEEIEVTYKQSSSYFVTIPKTIALGKNKQAVYSVKVTGEIDVNQRVYVAPVDGISSTESIDFYMKDQTPDSKKADVVATVAQNKSYWNSDDVANGYEETNNSISAPDLTTGTWKGNFQVEIRLETNASHIHNYVDGVCTGCGEKDPDAEHEHHYIDGKCECGEIDPNHEHNYEDGTCTICGKTDSYDIAPADAYNDWNYTLDEENKVITLNYYKGSKTDVIVYANYEVNGVTYKAQLQNSTYSSNLASYPTNYMFANRDNVKTIKFSDSLDTSNLTNMNHMFHECTGVTNIDFGNNFDTSNVTEMAYTFAGCNALTNLNINSFDTSKVTSMKYMFAQCHALTNLNLSSFDTGNVTNMWHMFYLCKSLTSLDLSSFDTNMVTIMDGMFKNCSVLNTIYVTDEKWSISKATTASMFTGCGASSVTYVE